MPSGKAAFAPLPTTPIAAPGFEGPFELLLRLLDEGGLEITHVSLLAVTEQYLAFLRLLPANAYRLDCLAEFLVVAAHLLLLKSRALLPAPEPIALAEEEVLDEATLEARLAEYRRYREAAARLRDREASGERAFTRQAPPPLPPPAPPPHLEGAAPAALVAALQRLLAARAPTPEPASPPRVTFAERIAEVGQIVARHGQARFTDLASTCTTRADLIITFLAILELYRRGALRLRQDGLFGEIWLAAV